MNFNIKIKNPRGKEKILNVNSNDQISAAKSKAGYTGYIFKFNGEVLKDDKTIEYYGIEEDDVIILNTPQIGGMNL
jgi:hypothetical protein